MMGDDELPASVPSMDCQSPNLDLIIQRARERSRANVSHSTMLRSRSRTPHPPKPVYKEVILLPTASRRHTLFLHERSFFSERKLLFRAVAFSRDMSAENVRTRILDTFQNHGPGVKFLVLEPTQKNLAEVPMAPGTSLNGQLLLHIFRQKSIYIAPEENLPEHFFPVYQEGSGLLNPNSDCDEEIPQLQATSEPGNSYLNKQLDSDSWLMEESSPLELHEDHLSNLSPSSLENVSPGPSSSGQQDILDDPQPSHSQLESTDDNSRTVQALLKQQQRQIMPTRLGYIKILARRNHVFASAMSYLAGESNFKKGLNVKFIDSRGRPEAGSDAGGLTREFFTLAFREIHRSSMLIGPDSCKDIVYDELSFQERAYYMMGVLIALAFAHGASGPRFFSPFMYECLQRGVGQVEPSLLQVHDPEVRGHLEALASCQVPEEFEVLKRSNHFTNCWDETTIQHATVDERDTLYNEALLHHTTNVRSAVAYEQFLEGLDTLGTRSLVLQNGEILAQEFVKKIDPLTMEQFIVLFAIKLSEEGSNAYNKEIDVLQLFYRFLEAVECNQVTARKGQLFEGEEEEVINLCLEDILQAATGSRTAPPQGFDFGEPTIRFSHEAPGNPLPTFCSCDGIIRLPMKFQSLIGHYGSFQNSLAEGVVNGLYQFGRV